MATQNQTDFELGKYYLDQTPNEIQRLELQYAFIKAGFGHRDILELPLDFSKAGELNILDIAAGSGAWILDVVKIPQVQSRLSPTGAADPVNIFACDLSPTKFPKSVTDPLGIHFFVQDVTKPFPEEMYGTFDLIHIGLLCFALTSEGWGQALPNIHRLLKPGGLLLQTEYNTGVSPPKKSIADIPICDIDTYVNTGSSVVDRANSIMMWSAYRNDFLVGFCARYPPMLESASFTILSVKYFDLPYGAARSNDQRSTPDHALFNLEAFMDTGSRSLLSQDDLEIPRGHKITTEEERKRALEDLVRDIRDKEGCFSGLAEWVIQKPL